MTATCGICGGQIPARDFSANYPFDSACACPSPFPPAPALEGLPAPNEAWFRTHTEYLGVMAQPVPTEGRPRLALVKKAAATRGAGGRPATRARGIRLA